MKRMLCIVLAVALLCSLVPIASAEWSGDGAKLDDGNTWYVTRKARLTNGDTWLGENECAVLSHVAASNGSSINGNKLEIPSTVKVDGKTLNVVAVAWNNYQGGDIRRISGLTEIIINAPVRVIGIHVFQYSSGNQYNGNLDNIVKVTLPATLTTINDRAFMDFGNIDFYFQGTRAQWNAVDKTTNNHFGTVHCSDDTVITPPATRTLYTEYAGYYKVKGTDGRLGLNSNYAVPSNTNGVTQLTTIPEGTRIYIDKATGYNGQGRSSGHWGQTTYNGKTGFCAMNYLELESSGSGGDGGDSCSTAYAGYYVVRGTSGRLAINNGHGYGTGYTQLGTIPEGTTVYIEKATGYNGWGKSAGNWGHVTYNGVTGLCAMNYLDRTDGDTCSASYAGVYKVTGTAGNLAINDGHGYGDGFTRLGVIPEGETVYISKAQGPAGTSGKWGHVTYNGVSGYCSMAYLRAASDATAPVIRYNPSMSEATRDGFMLKFWVKDNIRVTEAKVVAEAAKNGYAAYTGWASLDVDYDSDGEQRYAYYIRTADHNFVLGDYIVTLSVYDQAGNCEIKSYTFHLDDTPPEILNLKASNITADGFEVSFSTSDASTVESIELESWIDEELTVQVLDSSSGAFFVPAYVKDVTYHYRARAYDVFGNTNVSDTYTVYVDGTAPKMMKITAGTATTQGVDFTITATDDQGIRYYLAQVWTPDNGGGNGRDQVVEYSQEEKKIHINFADFGGETYTRYTVKACAVDACGNRSSWKTVSSFISPVKKVSTLPSGLKSIGSEAFMNTDMVFVVIPDGITNIRSKAFANSDLQYIVIPDTVTTIAADAFAGTTNVTILSSAASKAHEYATANDMTWVLLGE